MAAAADELTLLACELCRRLDQRTARTVAARGVPGVTCETFTSEHAVQTLMLCERLFDVNEAEKSSHKRTRKHLLHLLPNKLLRRHSLDFRRALDAWDQLVARSYVLHVDPRYLSLDGDRTLKHKDAVNSSTHFRFEPSRFAPFALRCAVLAVRGLPPHATASCVVCVGAQASDFAPLHDDEHRGSEAAKGTQYHQSEHPAFAHFGYDPLAGSQSLRVGLEWSGRGGRRNASWATTEVALSVPGEHEWRPSMPPVFDEDGALHAPLLKGKNDFELQAFESITSERCRWIKCDVCTGSDLMTQKVDVLVAAYVETQTASSSKMLSQDLQVQSWRVYVRVGRCMNCRSGGLGRLGQLGNEVTLQVASRVGTSEAKTPPLKKDFASDGCDFGNQRLRCVATVARQSGSVKVTLTERAALEHCGLGSVTVPLRKVPVIKANNSKLSTRREPPPKRYDITYRRMTGSDVKNGGVWLSVWMTPLLPPSTVAKRVVRWNYYFFMGLNFLAFLYLSTKLAGGIMQAAMVCSFIPLCRLALELPQLLGRSMTWILLRAVPGLNMAFGSIRLVLWFSDTKRTATSSAQDLAALAAGASRRLCVRVEVDDWAIRNPGPRAAHSHENFVSAQSVSLVLSFDARLLHGAIDTFRHWLRRSWSAQEDTRQRYLTVFREIDTDGSGSIDRKELQACLKRLGRKATPKETLRVLREADRDRSGHLDFDEFMRAMTCTTLSWASICKSTMTKRPPGIIRWSPFPSLHARDRALDDFEPTRIGSMRIDELSVDGVNIAFNLSTANEFNVCHFVRGLAEGKVGQVVGGRKAPNALKVTVISCAGVTKDVAPKVVLKLRDATWETSARGFGGGRHVWNEAWTTPCFDPSAVLHLGLVNSRIAATNKDLGQWLVTTKMVVVAPSNVFGTNLTHRREGNQYFLRGDMVLRGADFLVESGKDLTVTLELCYFYDDQIATNEVNYAQQMHKSGKRALEQLQQNSCETTWRMGNLSQVGHMLEDFPLLFDVRKFQVSRINFYLKDLFAGTATNEMIEAVRRRVLFAWSRGGGVRNCRVAPHAVGSMSHARRSTSSPSRARPRAASTTTSGLRSWI